MPFKYSPEGNIETVEVNGAKLPVFVYPDGKEVPFDADGTLGKISQLNGEAKTHRERAEAAEGKLKAFEGIEDPAAAIKALGTVANLDAKKLVDAGEIEKVKLEYGKALEAQYAPFKTRAEELEGRLNGLLINDVFSKSKFIAEKFAAEGPAGVEIARALFATRFKVEGDKVVAYDGQGNKLYSRIKPGEIADADEALELMVDNYPHKASILKGPGSSGGGAPNHGSGGGGGQPKTPASLTEAKTREERVAVLNARLQAAGNGE